MKLVNGFSSVKVEHTWRRLSIWHIVCIVYSIWIIFNERIVIVASIPDRLLANCQSARVNLFYLFSMIFLQVFKHFPSNFSTCFRLISTRVRLLETVAHYATCQVVLLSVVVVVDSQLCACCCLSIWISDVSKFSYFRLYFAQPNGQVRETVLVGPKACSS